jgi:hypothetical protein
MFPERIDVTITATHRPELLRRTLDSFFSKLFNYSGMHLRRMWEPRAIINVDPAGRGGDPCKIVDIVREYFPNVEARAPKEAGFGAAFKWCWTQTTAPWVFNLEEDWEALVPVDLSKMLEILQKEPKLALLRLPAFRANESDMKNWSHFYPWNGRYFECPHEKRIELGFCGHPSLIKGEFVRRCAPWLDPEKNPEKQFHRGHVLLTNEVSNWRYGVYGFPQSLPIIRDIGREWMVQNKFCKKGSKAYFTQWEEA